MGLDPKKKESILEAAVRAFTKWGFKKASIDEIAQEAGVAKGTVYLACESKEDLYYQAVSMELRDWIATVATRIDPTLKADELIRKLAGVSVEEMHSKPLVRDLLSGLIHGQFPAWSDRLEELRMLGVAPITQLVQLGVSQGVFRPELDVEEVARILQDLEVVAYIRYIDEWGQDRKKLDRRLKAGLDLILNGLKS